MNLLNYWQLFLRIHAQSGRHQRTVMGGGKKNNVNLRKERLNEINTHNIYV